MGNLFNNYEVKESINKIDDGSYESFKEGMIQASSIYEEKYKELAEQFKEQSKALTDISEKKDKLIDDLIEYSTERQNIAKDIKNKVGYLLAAIKDDYKVNLVTKPEMLLQVWQQEMLEKPNNPIVADKVEYFRHLCEQ